MDQLLIIRNIQYPWGETLMLLIKLKKYFALPISIQY